MTTDEITSNKLIIDKMAIDDMTTEISTTDEMTSDKLTTDQMTTDEKPSNKFITDKKMAIGEIIIDKLLALLTSSSNPLTVNNSTEPSDTLKALIRKYEEN